MREMKLDTDIIISGGGLVGASAACLLARNGFKVSLIDSVKHDVESINADPRIVALSRASQNILTQAGVWPRIDQKNLGPFCNMEVWDEAGTGRMCFDSAEVCEASLGHILAYRDITHAMEAQMAQTDNLELYRPIKVDIIEQHDDRIVVILEDGRRVQSSLLLIGEGANSPTRRMAEIGFMSDSYEQHAVSCVVRTEKQHEQTARQRFLRSGPLAFLPMANQYESCIVWSTEIPHAQELMQIDEQAFAMELASAFEYKLGNIELISKRFTFPLSKSQADHYCKPRIALIGDTAHTVHPLAGQGANLGLLDIAALTQILLETKQKNRDIGRINVLRRYERWRKGENQNMIRALDLIKELYAYDHKAISWCRNIGMDMIDKTSPVKRMIMQHAMGLVGDVPSLAKTTI